jgi:ABC-type phosphate transport system substrate-binding protein
MKPTISRTLPLAAIIALGALQSRALDAVVVANEGVAASSLDAGALKDIYNGKTMYWDGGQAIVIVVVDGKTDAALKDASGMDASQFKTFWQRLAFSGRGTQPKKVDDVAKALEIVASTKGAVALLPADAELKGVKKIDLK